MGPGRTETPATVPERISSGSGVDLRGQVVLEADLADELDLALEPVGVVLLAEEPALEQLARAVVALGAPTRSSTTATTAR